MSTRRTPRRDRRSDPPRRRSIEQPPRQAEPNRGGARSVESAEPGRAPDHDPNVNSTRPPRRH